MSGGRKGGCRLEEWGRGDIYILRGKRWRFAFDTWRMNGQEIELLDGWMERGKKLYTPVDTCVEFVGQGSKSHIIGSLADPGNTNIVTVLYCGERI